MSWKYVQRDTETGQYRTTDQGGGGGGSSTFAGLDDVSFSDFQNGQVPKYNSTTQKWENGRVLVYHYIGGTGTNIETQLATFNQNEDFVAVSVSNGVVGELVNLTNERLFMIKHMVGYSENTSSPSVKIEVAFSCTTGKIRATRVYNWWNNAWSSWVSPT